MKIALVFDAPRGGGPFSGAAGEYLRRLLELCEKLAGVEGVEYVPFYTISERLPGGATPPIDMIRKNRERLWGELLDYRPDKVLSFGAASLNAVSDEKRSLTITKERGRMRWLEMTRRIGEVHEYFKVAVLPTISNGAVLFSSDLHRDIAADVYKVLRQSEPLPPMEIDLRVPDTYHDLMEDLEDLDAASIVGVDVETTGLSPHNDGLLAVGIGAVYDSDHGLAVVVSRDMLAREGVSELLWDSIWRSSRRSVGHNFKFDMQFLAPLIGWKPDGAVVGDTLLLSYLLDERPNRPKSRVRGLGLKDQVATRYDLQYGFDFGEFYAQPDEEKDWDAMHVYLGQDVCYTARLWHDLYEEARQESLGLIQCHDTLLMPIACQIARCEWDGAPIDAPWVRETIAYLERRKERRRSVLEQMIYLVAPDSKVENILSPKQIADVMYDDWKMTPDVRKHGMITDDDRSTDKEHVKAAVAKYLGGPLDRQARWLRSLELLRKDVRLQTTYQKSLLDRMDKDGRVRANFMIHGTSTGRLSSQGPNLQNVPAIDREDAERGHPMRRAFRPKEGREWVEVDYSQLELRVAAALSGDKALTEVFKSGRDVHQEVASTIFSKPYDEVSKAERYLSKAVGFGIIYGRGAKALATGIEMRYVEQKLGGKAWTEDEAELFIRKFLRDYPELNAWMEKLYAEVPVVGYVESPFGRRRRFPLKPKSKGEMNAIQRQSVNTPVQSAASDICLEAMVRVARRIEAEQIDAVVLFPVHDSICFEVASEDVKRLESVCREEMERDFKGVPLTVDFEHGPTWADVKGDE